MIPLNAFSMVTFHGLIRKADEFIPQIFQRGVSRLGDIWDIGIIPSSHSGGFPVRPPSNLPPPGNEHLSVALGEAMGSGRVGTVHKVILLTHQTDLPPLIAKISRCNRSISMEKEAWFYEELEQVQGIAVPRCFGFFQTRVEEGVEVLTWNDPGYVEREEIDEGGFPVVKTELEDPTLLSVLLLECLGWNIPLGYRGFDYSSIKADVHEIYDDLARLGVEHVDFRWSNILSVVQYSEDEPVGPVCPNHGHAHTWRIVDFDLARKANCGVKCLESCYNSHLNRLFNNAPYGIVVEPWE